MRETSFYIRSAFLALVAVSVFALAGCRCCGCGGW
jgi:hypothetical protein